MVINKERKSKQEKDALAIRNIWPFLDKAKLNEISSKLTKKELKQVEAFMTEYGLEI